MGESQENLSSDILLALDDSDGDDDESGEEGEMFREDMNIDPEVEEEEFDDEEAEPKISISREHAKANYKRAGTEVPEKMSNIKAEDYAKVMNKDVEELLDQTVKDVKLKYTLSDFQRVVTVALGGGKNVVMVMGTGEGKMTVTLLAALLVRMELLKCGQIV